MAGRGRRSTISTRRYASTLTRAGWTIRHYQTGLAYFGQDRFEEAVGILEKVDMQSPDPWGKFYAVQVLVSAYAHLGRIDRIAVYMDQFKRQLAERKDEEPNLLLTQQFFVFKSEADISRLLAGLSKAGVPDLPPGVDLDPKDRLTGAEIKSLVFGHELRGPKIAPDTELYERTTSTDGSLRVTFGSTTLEGRSWVQGNFLCNAYPKELTVCGAIFRNSSGTPERQNEYRAVYRWEQFEFSVVR